MTSGFWGKMKSCLEEEAQALEDTSEELPEGGRSRRERAGGRECRGTGFSAGRMKILFVSLGCDKNLVDSEVMLGLLTPSRLCADWG